MAKSKEERVDAAAGGAMSVPGKPSKFNYSFCVNVSKSHPAESAAAEPRERQMALVDATETVVGMQQLQRHPLFPTRERSFGYKLQQPIGKAWCPATAFASTVGSSLQVDIGNSYEQLTTTTSAAPDPRFYTSTATVGNLEEEDGAKELSKKLLSLQQQLQQRQQLQHQKHLPSPKGGAVTGDQAADAGLCHLQFQYEPPAAASAPAVAADSRQDRLNRSESGDIASSLLYAWRQQQLLRRSSDSKSSAALVPPSLSLHQQQQSHNDQPEVPLPSMKEKKQQQPIGQPPCGGGRGAGATAARRSLEKLAAGVTAASRRVAQENDQSRSSTQKRCSSTSSRNGGYSHPERENGSVGRGATTSSSRCSSALASSSSSVQTAARTTGTGGKIACPKTLAASTQMSSKKGTSTAARANEAGARLLLPIPCCPSAPAAVNFRSKEKRTDGNEEETGDMHQRDIFKRKSGIPFCKGERGTAASGAGAHARRVAEDNGVWQWHETNRRHQEQEAHQQQEPQQQQDPQQQQKQSIPLFLQQQEYRSARRGTAESVYYGLPVETSPPLLSSVSAAPAAVPQHHLLNKQQQLQSRGRKDPVESSITPSPLTRSYERAQQQQQPQHHKQQQQPQHYQQQQPQHYQQQPQHYQHQRQPQHYQQQQSQHYQRQQHVQPQLQQQQVEPYLHQHQQDRNEQVIPGACADVEYRRGSGSEWRTDVSRPEPEDDCQQRHMNNERSTSSDVLSHTVVRKKSRRFSSTTQYSEHTALYSQYASGTPAANRANTATATPQTEPADVAEETQGILRCGDQYAAAPAALAHREVQMRCSTVSEGEGLVPSFLSQETRFTSLPLPATAGASTGATSPGVPPVVGVASGATAPFLPPPIAAASALPRRTSSTASVAYPPAYYYCVDENGNPAPYVPGDEAGWSAMGHQLPQGVTTAQQQSDNRGIYLLQPQQQQHSMMLAETSASDCSWFRNSRFWPCIYYPDTVSTEEGGHQQLQLMQPHCHGPINKCSGGASAAGMLEQKQPSRQLLQEQCAQHTDTVPCVANHTVAASPVMMQKSHDWREGGQQLPPGYYAYYCPPETLQQEPSLPCYPYGYYRVERESADPATGAVLYCRDPVALQENTREDCFSTYSGPVDVLQALSVQPGEGCGETAPLAGTAGFQAPVSSGRRSYGPGDPATIKRRAARRGWCCSAG